MLNCLFIGVSSGLSLQNVKTAEVRTCLEGFSVWAGSNNHLSRLVQSFGCTQTIARMVIFPHFLRHITQFEAIGTCRKSYVNDSKAACQHRVGIDAVAHALETGEGGSGHHCPTLKGV